MAKPIELFIGYKIAKWLDARPGQLFDATEIAAACMTRDNGHTTITNLIALAKNGVLMRGEVRYVDKRPRATFYTDGNGVDTFVAHQERASLEKAEEARANRPTVTSLARSDIHAALNGHPLHCWAGTPHHREGKPSAIWRVIK